MAKSNFVAATILAISLSLPAEAMTKADVFYRGADLLDVCTGEPRNLHELACGQYIAGALDGIESAASAFNRRFRFCEPKGVSADQRMRIIVKYLESDPEKLHQTAAGLIVHAMMEAFPCQGSTR